MSEESPVSVSADLITMYYLCGLLSIALILSIFKIFQDRREYEQKMTELGYLRGQVAKLPVLLENLGDLKNEKFHYEEEIHRLRKEAYHKGMKLSAYNEELERCRMDVIELESKLRLREETIEKLKAEKSELETEKSVALRELTLVKEGNEKLMEEFEKQSSILESKLDEIMRKSVEKEMTKLDRESAKNMESILSPFKERLEIFRRELQKDQENSKRRFTELTKEIEILARTGMNISKEAANLAEALKGKKQMQGGWGEMILDSVLEYSGLLAGVHYEKQSSYRDDDGDIKRPDVIVKLPGERNIVIDSKVPLNSYDAYIRASSDKERDLRASELVKAFRKHIDELSERDYSRYSRGTLQYVFMFVPIEGAFVTAVQSSPSLYEYALRKHIAIVTPSTLTVSLRTIYLYWQSEQSGAMAIKLFEEAGKLYDKIVVFSETFQKIGSQLETVQKSYEKAYRQLAHGSGNILKKSSKLKELGARTTKSLKDTGVEYDDMDVEPLEKALPKRKKEID